MTRVHGCFQHLAHERKRTTGMKDTQDNENIIVTSHEPDVERAVDVQLLGNLMISKYDKVMRHLHLDDIHHTLEDQLGEVETVAHIIVSRYGLRGVVDHHRAPAFLAVGVQCQNATPVEL